MPIKQSYTSLKSFLLQAKQGFFNPSSPFILCLNKIVRIAKSSETLILCYSGYPARDQYYVRPCLFTSKLGIEYGFNEATTGILFP